ncbi:WD repeat-containing protein CG11141 [Anopheles stephensi]|uniref:WD repeat-containing protein 55 homolog n=1 Tax=Anopheles stephensi TaxID=30069 RepID=A0A182YDC4_ANOST|nr:WD repeat-containing protein CG11141 [Anopheles stephensi]
MNTLREWSPLVELVNKIPASVQRGLLFHDVSITCVDLVEEFIALGSNVGLVFWYNRKTGTVERLATDSGSQELTCVRIASTVEYMVAAGCRAGQVNIFQIPKTPPPDVCAELLLKAKPIERYTVRGLHRAGVCELVWSKNGMRLFSGDTGGSVVLTEIGYATKTCQSREIINERYEIVQMDLYRGKLLVSSSFRTVICSAEEEPEGGQRWRVAQVGKKDRKMLAPFGAVFATVHGKQQLVSTRSGFRLWLADDEGNVAQTLIFKELMRAPYPEIGLLNPSRNPIRIPTTFGKLYPFEDRRIVTVANGALFLLDLERMAVVGGLTRLRHILDVAVDRNEILIVESGRSLVRIATLPDSSQSTIVLKNLELFVSAESQIVQADECCEEAPAELLVHNGESPGSSLPGDDRIDQVDGGMEDDARLIDSHMKKLELFDTLNELKYDESILFKSGRSRRKHRSKVTNPIVEIGQIPKEIEPDSGEPSGS